MSTAAPNRSAVVCSWMHQGWGDCSQRCCSSTPTGASKPPQKRDACVSFLRSDSRCRRYVSDLSNVTPRYLGSEQLGRFSLLKLTFSSNSLYDCNKINILCVGNNQTSKCWDTIVFYSIGWEINILFFDSTDGVVRSNWRFLFPSIGKNEQRPNLPGYKWQTSECKNINKGLILSTNFQTFFRRTTYVAKLLIFIFCER